MLSRLQGPVTDLSLYVKYPAGAVNTVGSGVGIFSLYVVGGISVVGEASETAGFVLFGI
jgi:hypothetical protein